MVVYKVEGGDANQTLIAAHAISCHLTELVEKGYGIYKYKEGNYFDISRNMVTFFVNIHFEDELDEMRYLLEYGES